MTQINRRRSLIAFVLVFAFQAATTLAEEPNVAGDQSVDLTADEALNLLIEGNRRFADCNSQHPHESKTWRQQLEEGQHPVAVVVGCADSRVTPELIFDRGLGDLFVVRVAGNIVDTDVVASVEYAVDHLETHLIVVLGHTGCGAVTAAVDHLAESNREPDEVVSLLYRIEPALDGIPSDMNRDDQIKAAVRNNVELATQRLSHVPDLMKSLKREKVAIVGAVYDMHSGQVETISKIDAKGHHWLNNIASR